MSYEKITTTTINGKTRTHWKIQAGERRWVLTQTKYLGGSAAGFWGIAEADGSKGGDATLTIATDDDDNNPRPMINWPCKGAQPLQEALAFKRDIGNAAQAATDAEYIINHEA